MYLSKSIEEYIELHPDWSEALIKLRAIILATGMKETLKWGAPTYTVNGKNVAGLGAFKSYVGVWFHQGVFLQDEAGKLINAQKGKTKALRQWRFQSVNDIEEDLLKAYLFEAIENQKQGKEIKPNRSKKELIIPDELVSILAENIDFKQQFESLSPGKQREYADYITEAKRESTKLSRIDKIIPMVLAGVGLNDKYKR